MALYRSTRCIVKFIRQRSSLSCHGSMQPHYLTNDRTSDHYKGNEVFGAIVICNRSSTAASLADCACC